MVNVGLKRYVAIEILKDELTTCFFELALGTLLTISTIQSTGFQSTIHCVSDAKLCPKGRRGTLVPRPSE